MNTPLPDAGPQYWNEQECTTTLRANDIQLLFELSVLFAVGILFDNVFLVGIVFNTVLSACATSRIRHRIRRGEAVAKPTRASASTPQAQKRDTTIFCVIMAVMTLIAVWFSLFRLLPILIHPHAPIRLLAALYLQTIIVALAGLFWHTTLKTVRNRKAVSLNLAESSAAVAVSPVETAMPQSATALRGPLYWWTDSGTRAEVNEQRLGR